MRCLRLALMAFMICSTVTLAAQTLPTPVDSIVLYRTSCYKYCPTYRLTVTRQGMVHFAGETYSVASDKDSIADSLFTGLVATAQRIQLSTFPAHIDSDRNYCPNNGWTDFPTAIIAVYGNHKVFSVNDYLGCANQIEEKMENHPLAEPYRQRMKDLRAFEDLVDTLTKSSRWMRPPPPRH